MGRQRFFRRPCLRPTKPWQWERRPVGGARPSGSIEFESGGCVGEGRSWVRAVKCALTWGPDRRKAVRRRSPSHSSSRSPQGSRGSGSEPAGGQSRREPRCSGIGRSTGARAVRWLQMSVRSTFSAASRSAERQTEVRRGSAVGRPRNLDEDGIARLPGQQLDTGRKAGDRNVGRKAGAGAN
jgi:hypothetical protein